MSDRPRDSDRETDDEGTEREPTDSDYDTADRANDPDVVPEAERGDPEVESETDRRTAETDRGMDERMGDVDREVDERAGEMDERTGDVEQKAEGHATDHGTSDTATDVGSDAERRQMDAESDADRRATDASSTRDTAGADTDPDEPHRSDSAARQRHPDDDPSEQSGMGSNTMRWLSAVVALVGLWIAVSPFVYDTTQVATWNNLVTGGAILLLAGYGFYRTMERHRPDVGSSSLVALLGLWALVAPFLLAYGSNALVWSTMASGLAVAILSGYNAYESRRSDITRTTETRI